MNFRLPAPGNQSEPGDRLGRNHSRFRFQPHLAEGGDDMKEMFGRKALPIAACHAHCRKNHHCSSLAPLGGHS